MRHSISIELVSSVVEVVHSGHLSSADSSLAAEPTIITGRVHVSSLDALSNATTLMIELTGRAPHNSTSKAYATQKLWTKQQAAELSHDICLALPSGLIPSFKDYTPWSYGGASADTAPVGMSYTLIVTLDGPDGDVVASTPVTIVGVLPAHWIDRPTTEITGRNEASDKGAPAYPFTATVPTVHDVAARKFTVRVRVVALPPGATVTSGGAVTAQLRERLWTTRDKNRGLKYMERWLPLSQGPKVTVKIPGPIGPDGSLDLALDVDTGPSLRPDWRDDIYHTEHSLWFSFTVKDPAATGIQKLFGRGRVVTLQVPVRCAKVSSTVGGDAPPAYGWDVGFPPMNKRREGETPLLSDFVIAGMNNSDHTVFSA